MLLWHKYLEFLGKNNIFTHVFLQYVMEDEHTKEPLHNNPEEAANYVKAINLLLQSFVNDIHGFNHQKCLEAYETFLHTLSQLLSKLDSVYFTNMDTEVVLDTIPDTIILCYIGPENRQNPTTKDTNFGKLHSLTPAKMPTNKESIHFSRTLHHI